MFIQTPRGRVVQTKNGKATLEWNPSFQSKWEGQYTKAQVFIDSEVLRLSAPYIPFETSMLQKSGILGTVAGSGTVEWIAPYAKYLYYGNVMVSPTTGSPWAKKGERKVLTDKPLNYNGAPKRGRLWFERMKADHKKDIVEGARKLAGGSSE